MDRFLTQQGHPSQIWIITIGQTRLNKEKKPSNVNGPFYLSQMISVESQDIELVTRRKKTHPYNPRAFFYFAVFKASERVIRIHKETLEKQG